MEALCGLGEPTGALPVVAEAVARLREVSVPPARTADTARADIGDRLQIAREMFEQAVALRPSHAPSHEALGRNLLGASSLCNYGAQAAGSLHSDEAEVHLRTALRLAPEAEGVEGLQALLDSIEQTRREVAEWERVVHAESHREGEIAAPAPAEGAPGETQPRAGDGAAAAWHPSVLARAFELPRVTVQTAADFQAVLRRGEPAVLLGLQQGFAPREAWTPVALRQAFGHSPVKVSVSPSGRFDGPEPGAWWGLDSQSGAPVVEEVLVRPPETHMRLGDALSLLSMRTPERFYVEYAAMHQVRSLPDPVSASSPLGPWARVLYFACRAVAPAGRIDSPAPLGRGASRLGSGTALLEDGGMRRTLL
jgi:jumonji domain-containing protein 7